MERQNASRLDRRKKKNDLFSNGVIWHDLGSCKPEDTLSKATRDRERMRQHYRAPSKHTVSIIPPNAASGSSKGRINIPTYKRNINKVSTSEANGIWDLFTEHWNVSLRLTGEDLGDTETAHERSWNSHPSQFQNSPQRHCGPGLEKTGTSGVHSTIQKNTHRTEMQHGVGAKSYSQPMLLAHMHQNI